MMKLVEATRLFGGTGGDSFDHGVHTTIRELVIYSSEVIESIQIEYDQDGQSKWSDTHGRKEGKKNTVSFSCLYLILLLDNVFLDTLVHAVTFLTIHVLLNSHANIFFLPM